MGPDSQRVVVGNTCVLVFLPNYRDLFKRMFKTLRAFAPSSSEFIPFLQTEGIHGLTRFCMRSKFYLHLNSFWMPYDLVRLSINDGLNSLFVNISLGAGEILTL